MARDYFTVEPDTLRQTKDSMSQILQQAEAELKTLNATMQTLNAAWQGPSNLVFRQVFQEDFIEAQDCCTAIRSKLSDLERDAQAYQSCEAEVLQRVQRL